MPTTKGDIYVQIRLNPATRQRLRVLAVDHMLTQSEMITVLINNAWVPERGPREAPARVADAMAPTNPATVPAWAGGAATGYPGRTKT